MRIPKLNTQKIKADLKDGFNDLAKGGFQKIFSHIDQLNIKKGVDSMGIDKFVNQCALMAAGSGVITGIGGLAGGIGSTLINKGSGLLFDHAKDTNMVFMGFKGIEAGYFIIFSICAVCYLTGWIVMKSLVPKYSPITNL